MNDAITADMIEDGAIEPQTLLHYLRRSLQEPGGWEWFGNAGHFIMGHRCRFHMATKVGMHLISTVGELPNMVPGSNEGLMEIGWNRFYETMAFVAGTPCECGCGVPQCNGIELEMLPANDAKTARENHMLMCWKYHALTQKQLSDTVSAHPQKTG